MNKTLKIIACVLTVLCSGMVLGLSAAAPAPSKKPAAKTAVKKTKKPVSAKTAARRMRNKALRARIKTNIKKPVDKIKKAAKPVGKAIKKTAEKTVEETAHVVQEAHTFGGKFLQAAIDIMIAASPGKTRVYLPAIASDPNSGITMGVLPVFLFVDKQDMIRHIMAPSVTYNKLFGVNATMRYYYYPHPGAQFFTLAAYAVETNRRFALRYEDPNLFADWFYFKFDFNAERDASCRFFGIGPRSRTEDQANYTLRDNHLKVFTGVNFMENFRLTLGNRFRLANAVDGPIDSLAKISDFDPRPTGVMKAKWIVAQRLALSYDSRNGTVTPVRGHYAEFFGELGGRLGGDSAFERMGVDLRGLYPMKEDKLVTGWHFSAEKLQDGNDVPFYERSLLGGRDSLRGFGDARFVDQNKISWTIEERIRFWRLNAFNVNVDFEVTPFYEAGTVFPQNGDLRGSDLHHVGGVGFRSVVRPNVVGAVDLGFGEDGLAIFVKLDYPF